MKTDNSIHNICIAAIKRHTMKPLDFKWTQYYEEKDDFLNRYINMIPTLEATELPICSTIIDANNWSVLTTRRLFTNKSGELTEAAIDDSKNISLCNFKGGRNEDRVMGRLQLANGTTMDYHIESGKASMVMIYGIRTRIRMHRGQP